MNPLKSNLNGIMLSTSTVISELVISLLLLWIRIFVPGCQIQECRDRTSSTTTTVTESTESTTTGSTESTTTGTTTTFTGGAGPTPSELNIMWLCKGDTLVVVVDRWELGTMCLNICAFFFVFSHWHVQDACVKFPTPFWEKFREKYVSYASGRLDGFVCTPALRSCQGTLYVFKFISRISTCLDTYSKLEH